MKLTTRKNHFAHQLLGKYQQNTGKMPN